MIASLSGTVQRVEPGSIVILVGGVGLRVFAPRSVLEDAGGLGRHMTLHTHLLVREDELSLYGFKTEDDLQLFELLLSVNGVGPRVALSILSTLSPELLQSAVTREDAAVLQRVPGIGKKTAERIMFQLRDKFDVATLGRSTPLISDVDADVIDILTGLGFSIVEAQSALQNIPQDAGPVDERVQLALQYLDQSGRVK